MLIAALITLGFALARYDIARRAEDDPRVGRRLVAVALPVGIALSIAQLSTQGTETARTLSPFAGWVLGLGYIGLVLVLLRTPAGGALTAVFRPLGRIALTMYLSVTLVTVAIRPLADTLGLDTTTGGFLRMMAYAVGLVVVQVLLARWWLARHDQGPLEALWRRVTWWGPRVDPAVAHARALSGTRSL